MNGVPSPLVWPGDGHADEEHELVYPFVDKLRIVPEVYQTRKHAQTCKHSWDAVRCWLDPFLDEDDIAPLHVFSQSLGPSLCLAGHIGAPRCASLQHGQTWEDRFKQKGNYEACPPELAGHVTAITITITAVIIILAL